MKLSIAILAAAFAVGAQAKLPDPSDEAKAKAELTKAENAHKGKIAGYQLCKSQDAVAKKFLASAAGKGMKADTTAPCADPGKFVPPEIIAAAPGVPAAAPVAAPAAAVPAAPAAKK